MYFDRLQGNNEVKNEELIYNAEDLWKKIVEALIKEIPAISLDMWIKPLLPIKIENNYLYIKAPTENNKRMVIDKFGTLIDNLLLRTNDKLSGVYVITEVLGELKPEQLSFNERSPLDNTPLFKKEYNFEDFVVGRSNQFAYLTAKAVAEYPGERHNPLFIFGGVGLGKTHLLHAIGNQMLLEHPQKKIVYISFEKFMNELLSSMSGNRAMSNDFKDRYRKVDVLMVDDIQFIAGKERTQEEFFHTFEQLYNENKQIIIASDRPPKDINPLEERLRSRFNWDVTVDIQPPDLETRTAILQRHAQKMCLNADLSVLEYISGKIVSNIRDLIGFFKKATSYSLLMHRQLTVELINELLKDRIDEKNEEISIDAIIEAVCSYYKVDKAEIKARRRNREVVEPRMMCIYLASQLLPTMPIVKIAQEFNRDHSTIIHGRDKIMELVATGGKTKTIAQDIAAMLKVKI